MSRPRRDWTLTEGEVSVIVGAVAVGSILALVLLVLHVGIVEDRFNTACVARGGIPAHMRHNDLCLTPSAVIEVNPR